jgi:hypothetical protein
MARLGRRLAHGSWTTVAPFAALALLAALVVWWVFGGGSVDSRATQLGAVVGIVGVLFAIFPTVRGGAKPSRQIGNDDQPHGVPDRPPQVPQFGYREAEQARVSELMQSSGVVAIEGAPGTGKTQLALAVVRDFERMELPVAWLRGASRAQLRSDVTTLAVRHPSPAANAFRAWLRENPGGLVVIDGLASRTVLSEWDFTDLSGNVLITMRGMLGEYGESIELTNWEVADAARFVLTSTNAEEGSTDLARRLSGNPLLISTAVAFMNDAGVDAATYLRELHKLDEGPAGTRQATLHADPLEPLVRVALGTIRDNRTRELLLCLAFMEGEGGISLDIVQDIWNQVERRRTRSGATSYVSALAALSGVGLLRPGGKSVFMHKHVTRTLIQYAGTGERSSAVLRAAESLEFHMRVKDEAHEAERLSTLHATLGHVLSVASWAESLTPTTWPQVHNWALWMSRLSASVALSSVAARLLAQGQEEDARESATRAFELARSACPYAMGFYPPEVGRCMPAVSYTAQGAAMMSYRAGDVTRAMEILDWTLNVLGSKRWNLSALRRPVANLKAQALIDAGRPGEAVELLRVDTRSRRFRRLPAGDKDRMETQRCLEDALRAVASLDHE